MSTVTGAPIASKESVGARALHHHRVGVVSAPLLRKPNARGNLQRCKLFARDLQWALEAIRVQCRMRMREAWHAMVTHGARLRRRLAPFFGKAKR